MGRAHGFDGSFWVEDASHPLALGTVVVARRARAARSSAARDRRSARSIRLAGRRRLRAPSAARCCWSTRSSARASGWPPTRSAARSSGLGPVTRVIDAPVVRRARAGGRDAGAVDLRRDREVDLDGAASSRSNRGFLGLEERDEDRRLHAVPGLVRLVHRAAPRTQRARRSAIELEAVDLRASTPLKAGQVDDTPYGGGAGMVIRVDVVEAALAGALRRRPAGAAASQRRVVALAPGGRRLDDALAAELAAEDELTLLCGRYEGFDERVHEQPRDRRGLDRALRPLRRRAGGDGGVRHRAAQAARRARPRGERGGGVVQPGARRRAGVSALHAAVRLARPRRSRRCCCRAITAASASGASSRAGERGADGCREQGTASLRYHSASRGVPPGAAPAFVPPARSRPPLLMSGVIDSIERAQLRRVPVFQAGDRVRVHFQVVEGTRRRTQVFEGVVIKRQGSGARETFTVRKQSFGVGVERTFPLHSPKIEQIEVAARGDVRRAKLYYLRDRVGRGARVRERRWAGADEQAYVEGAMPPDDAPRPGEEELAEAPRPRLRPRRPMATRPRPRQTPADEAAAPSAQAGRRDGRRLRRTPAAERRRRRPTPSAPPRSRVLGRAGGLAEGTWPRVARRQSTRGSLDRAGHDRRRGARARARHPGIPRQAVPDPERVDGADARHRPARARGPRRACGSAIPSSGDIMVFKPPAGARHRSVRRRARRRTRRARARRRSARTRTSSSASSPPAATACKVIDGRVVRERQAPEGGVRAPGRRAAGSATCRARSRSPRATTS